MKDVMLDLETFGTRHDALIVQIGACYFDRMTGEVGETFFRNIRPGKYIDKFSVDYDTITWWLQQSEEARAAIYSSSAHIEEALRDLRDFLTYNSRELFVWSHATFDMPILQHAFAALDVHYPVPFRNLRDLRTLMDITQHRSTTEREGTHHNALDDAKFQATCAAEAFRKLNASA